MEASLKSLEVRPKKGEMIKPGEVIDFHEVTPLTLQDRRIYNILIDHAWKNIGDNIHHEISKSLLRPSRDQNDRVGESIERLMGSIVQRLVVNDGLPAIERYSLLGDNCEYLSKDGLFHYSFSPGLRALMKDSVVFARLRKEVLFAFTSKYSLTFYELVAKRINMRHKVEEVFTLDMIRGLLGVPEGKLSKWGDLERRALRIACQEVNKNADFMVKYLPVKVGKRVNAVKVLWARK